MIISLGCYTRLRKQAHIYKKHTKGDEKDVRESRFKVQLNPKDWRTEPGAERLEDDRHGRGDVNLFVFLKDLTFILSFSLLLILSP